PQAHGKHPFETLPGVPRHLVLAHLLEVEHARVERLRAVEIRDDDRHRVDGGHERLRRRRGRRREHPDRGDAEQEPSHTSRSFRCAPTRSALAMIVSAGLTAAEDGKKLPSTTYRLSTSCALQFTSSAEVFGSRPKRMVPF